MNIISFSTFRSCQIQRRNENKCFFQHFEVAKFKHAMTIDCCSSFRNFQIQKCNDTLSMFFNMFKFSNSQHTAFADMSKFPHLKCDVSFLGLALFPQPGLPLGFLQSGRKSVSVPRKWAGCPKVP